MDPKQIFTNLTSHPPQLPPLSQIFELLDASIAHFAQIPLLINLQAPLTIVGDLHGQFGDFIEMLRISGIPPYTNYLFLGDYVDRGISSLETVITLLAARLAYPGQISLLRGNHETATMGEVYGFYAEIQFKFNSPLLFSKFNELFDLLPAAAVVGGALLAVHAGLSPMAETLDDIVNADSDVITDLLWSDPDARPGYGRSMRGAGYTFGQDVTESFLRENGLKLLVRGHQMVQEGYFWQHGKQVVTVFSAPNYCYRSGNMASVMEIQEGLGYNFIQFGWEGQKGVSGVQERVPEYFM